MSNHRPLRLSESMLTLNWCTSMDAPHHLPLIKPPDPKSCLSKILFANVSSMPEPSNCKLNKCLNKILF